MDPFAPEDKEFVEEVHKLYDEAKYNNTYTMYVGPGFYQRMMREPYFKQDSALLFDRPVLRGVLVVIVYPDKAVAGKYWRP